ncbi:MAG: tetratricopeptide repeat protein, partial [Chloroflexi bacterium]|nr:tetratricopeptide repeat protein [Chloroflexota bacterium]
MAHSLAKSLNVTCPECGHAFEAAVWLIVDCSERPDLVERIQDGTLHELSCPACDKVVGQADAPLLVYRSGQVPPILSSPAQGTTAEQDQEQAAGLVGLLRERLGEDWQDEWLAQGLPGVQRAMLPAALSAVPQAALREMQAQAREVEVLTRAARPVEWATAMNDLANAYYARIQGERAENLEAAIEAYQQALEVRTRAARPVEWAATMNNLAAAYYARIQGERAENLEAAIEAYQQALEVRTRA